MVIFVSINARANNVLGLKITLIIKKRIFKTSSKSNWFLGWSIFVTDSQRWSIPINWGTSRNVTAFFFFSTIGPVLKILNCDWMIRTTQHSPRNKNCPVYFSKRTNNFFKELYLFLEIEIFLFAETKRGILRNLKNKSVIVKDMWKER